MALILCPNCGNRVSSTAETCVHCGCVLTKFVENRNYKSLSSGEMEALQKEFRTLNPEFAEYEKEKNENTNCFNKYLNLLRIMCIICFFAIGGSIWAVFAINANNGALSTPFSENPATWLPVISLVFGVACYFGILVLGVVRIFLVNYFNNRLVINDLIIMTKYKVWLKEAKNIDYEITGIKDKYMDYIRDFEYEGVNGKKLKRS